MKTLKILFLGIVLILSGCTKSDDFSVGSNNDLQLKSAENGSGYTEQFYFNPGPVYDEQGNVIGNDYWCPVICDGVEVDYLVGDGGGLSAHAIIHFKDGEMQWGKWLVQGSLTSELTGEKFIIHETNKGEFDKEEGFYYLLTHTNAIGDKGTHMLLSSKFLWPTSPDDVGEYLELNAKCVTDN